MCPEAAVKTTDVSKENNQQTTQEQIPRKGFCTVRHGLAFILHFCNFSIYAQQTNLSIAITAMVNNTALPSQANASLSSQDNWNETQTEFQATAPAYDWSPEIQGTILSSLNYGSFLAPIPTGYVAGVFGAKYVVGVGLIATSVLGLLIPLAADAGVAWLIVVRVFQGIAQVMVFTGQYALWVRWAPPVERNQLISIAVSGAKLGSFLVLLVGGLICQNLGWPYVFYIFGAIGCVCCLLWFPLVYNDPKDHPFISAGEKSYIACSLAQQDLPKKSLPIKAMIKCLPLWAILVSYFCEYWTVHIVTSYSPTYIRSILQTSVTTSGMLSSLPHISGCICIILGGLLADFLLSRKILRLIVVRKLFTTIGVLGSSVVLVSLYWVKSSPAATITFLILTTVFTSFNQPGSLINFLDIAPRYAGFIKGLMQVFAILAGAISPTVAGVLVGQDSELGWRNVFLLAAAIDISGLIFYLIFGRAHVQDWAKEETSTHF
ncbi:probable small intestine urate exporter isoform X1 [Oryctolagus cuniculus]|uniref:Solute carrier family 17 member 4 n=1 Tax=Oryctolagus cuniculus TaxID=9986 RepID=G1T6J5_RABIT|nr:probable small intestine urate exporter [Oryctolagus cuniculus]